jgi:predicted permease
MVRDGILGDLFEMYVERRAAHGRLRAALWYWYEAALAATRYTIERLSCQMRFLRRRYRPHGPGSRTKNPMEAIFQDLRYASRVLKKAPGFTVIAALTIGLGIGATTTIFSVVNAVLLRAPSGVRGASELVRVYRIAEDDSSFNSLSYPNYRDYRDGDNGLTDLAAMSMVGITIAGSVKPEVAVGFLVTHNFFDVVGVRPALGRLFLPEDDEPGTPLVAVLSHATWKRRFGADSSIVGQTIRLNRHTFTVIGVTQEGFRGPVSLLDIGAWLPMSAAPAMNDDYQMNSRRHTWVDALGRRSPGVTPAQASAALNRISHNLRATFPDGNPDYGIGVQRYAPVSRRVFGPAAAFSAFLFVMSGTVLLIASINVASMLLSRATQRRREVALRLALGARRMRLVRQLLTESVMLFGLGAGAGVLITLYATRLLSTYQLPFDLPVVFDFSPDVRAFVFSLGIALLTGLLFGMAPALQITKPDLTAALRVGSSSGSIVRSHLRSAFVVAQVAGSALLLVVAGLFTRGLSRANDVNLGFEPANVHALSTELDFHGNYADEDAVRFYRDLAARVSMVPEVESFGFVDWPPVTLGGQAAPFAVIGGDAIAEEDWPSTEFARVTPGFIETLRIPIVRGRNFAETDREGAPMVAVVNETFARRAWPGEHAIGKRIRLRSGDDPELEIVGVARDAKYRTLAEDPRNMVYVPYWQWPTSNMVMFARITRNGTAVVSTFRDIVRELDADLPIDANVPYEELMGIALLPSRATAVLTTIFGAVGLVLASLGLYGVLAYSVTQRTREFGIRLALGAEHGKVRTLVLRDGVKLAAVGLAIGLGIALATTHLLRGFLHGLSPTDPITFGGIALLLIAVAVAASYLPALRATRTDPVEALRAE